MQKNPHFAKKGLQNEVVTSDIQGIGEVETRRRLSYEVHALPRLIFGLG